MSKTPPAVIAPLRRYRFSLLGIMALLVASIAWFAPWQATAPKPLYWVSSMDPNYRSDKPGKCPHGMDLIPVYAEDAKATEQAGRVKINPAVQQQMAVRKVKVARGVLNQRLQSFGRVVADPSLVSPISPRSQGWVDMLFVSGEGEAVKKGQPLFSFYSPDLIEAQERYLAARRQGAAQAMKAEEDLKDLQMDSISLARLKDQGLAQRSVIFHAPKDGVVDMLKLREKAYFSPGQMVMAIGSMERVWVWLEVFASQGPLIAPRQAVSLTSQSLPGKVWEGEVDAIAPDLDPKSRSLRLRVSLANPNMQLRPNMLMQGLISLPPRPPALLVSRQAVIELDNQARLVMEAPEGTFKSVGVTLGARNEELVEVLAGVEEGDIVVTSAQFLIDAESSKSSDLKRLQAPEVAPAYPPTWVKARISQLFPNERKIQLEHEAITACQMPGMTMNFALTDAINIEHFKLGDQLNVKITDGSPLFQIIDVKAADESP
ncbi:MAG TPA: efflux RND transporter periplasmic adaptor subunit [Cellvibrionaceae bacterium]|nr:efflux RND transporter periplasmic adaptor subunit [Cellvibrionaceae bacterium]